MTHNTALRVPTSTRAGHPQPARWGALALGALCATGAAAILLQDIAATGKVSVDHGLSVIVLVGTIAAGHFAAGELRQWRLGRALALAGLFALGSAWCILSTAGRQADGQAQARAEVERANRTIVLKGDELKIARQRLADAEAEALRECRTGFKAKCEGWQRAAAERQSHVNGLVAEIGRLGALKVGDQKLANVAAIAATVTGGDAARIEATLAVTWPFVPALFLELGSILFFGMGLGTAPVAGGQPKARETEPRAITERADPFTEEELEDLKKLVRGADQSDADTDPTPPRGPRRRTRDAHAEARNKVMSFRAAYVARHNREPSASEIASATGVPRTSCWRYASHGGASVAHTATAPAPRRVA